MPEGFLNNDPTSATWNASMPETPQAAEPPNCYESLISLDGSETNFENSPFLLDPPSACLIDSQPFQHDQQPYACLNFLDSSDGGTDIIGQTAYHFSSPTLIPTFTPNLPLSYQTFNDEREDPSAIFLNSDQEEYLPHRRHTSHNSHDSLVENYPIFSSKEQMAYAQQLPTFIQGQHLFNQAPAYQQDSPPEAYPPIGEHLKPNVQPPPYSLEKPFQCAKCGSRFSRNHDLKRHSRIHLAIKPFPCGWCDKAFSRKDALKRHLIVKGCSKSKQITGEVQSPERGQGDRQLPIHLNQTPKLWTTSTTTFRNEGTEEEAQSPKSTGTESYLSNNRSDLFGQIKLQNITCAIPSYTQLDKLGGSKQRSSDDSSLRKPYHRDYFHCRSQSLSQATEHIHL